MKKKWLVLIDSSVGRDTLPKFSEYYWCISVADMPEKIQFIEIPTNRKWWQFWKK